MAGGLQKNPNAPKPQAQAKPAPTAKTAFKKGFTKGLKGPKPKKPTANQKALAKHAGRGLLHGAAVGAAAYGLAKMAAAKRRSI